MSSKGTRRTLVSNHLIVLASLPHAINMRSASSGPRAMAETIAFFNLLQRVFASLAASGLPMPPAAMQYITWICDDVLSGFQTFAYRNPACKWQLAAAASSVLLAVLEPYDLVRRRCSHRARSLPAHAFVVLPWAAVGLRRR